MRIQKTVIVLIWIVLLRSIQCDFLFDKATTRNKDAVKTYINPLSREDSKIFDDMSLTILNSQCHIPSLECHRIDGKYLMANERALFDCLRLRRCSDQSGCCPPSLVCSSRESQKRFYTKRVAVFDILEPQYAYFKNITVYEDVTCECI